MMANDTRLQHIQALQFSDRAAAEGLLLDFVRETFPALEAVKVELRPLAVSLNSFNGFLTLANGDRLFYKTHVEPGSVIDEYYNSTLLAQSGYPVILPRYASTEYGKQFLIYNVIDSPSVFDVAHAIELGERADLPELTAAQNRADDQLLQIYQATWQPQPAEEAAKVAVHQLFSHRLGARYNQFYAGKTIQLPGCEINWEALCARQWQINGVRYRGTLGETIDRAREVLQPAQAGPAIVGHGDAHNGNVFFTPDGLIPHPKPLPRKEGGANTLVYFDPAFGGRHHPLLDLAKPLFHNVFATWMYHPAEVAAALRISLEDDGVIIHVNHDYDLSACRRMFFQSKMERVLKPLSGELRKQAAWRTFLKSALMCCPLLTMNLAESSRFPAAITLLGLCFAVEMGMESSGSECNTLNKALDEIEAVA